MSSSKKKTKPFAEGICYDKLLIIFIIGSCIGTYYEEILTCIKFFLKTGEPLWESRRGVIYGPFNPLYGFGLCLITYTFFKIQKKRKPWEVFVLACLLGGVIEYAVSFLQEFVVGTVSWNYSKKFLNIHGRTTIPFMIFWGLCASIWIYKFYPKVSKWIEQIPYKIGKTVVVFFTVFLTLDMIISWTALLRQDLRRKNIAPITPIGEFLDQYYTDEYLHRYYPNMVHTSEVKK